MVLDTGSTPVRSTEVNRYGCKRAEVGVPRVSKVDAMEACYCLCGLLIVTQIPVIDMIHCILYRNSVVE